MQRQLREYAGNGEDEAQSPVIIPRPLQEFGKQRKSNEKHESARTDPQVDGGKGKTTSRQIGQ